MQVITCTYSNVKLDSVILFLMSSLFVPRALLSHILKGFSHGILSYFGHIQNYP